jgi:hypothetical protein
MGLVQVHHPEAGHTPLRRRLRHREGECSVDICAVRMGLSAVGEGPSGSPAVVLMVG